MNHGIIMEVAHIGQSKPNNDSDPDGQQPDAREGERHPPTLARPGAGSSTANRSERRHHNPRGSRFRLVTCSDRPPTDAYGTLNTTFADRMIRNNGSLYPRINSACCKRPDGRWTFVCCNTTHGARISPPISGLTDPATPDRCRPRWPLRRRDDPGHRDDPGSG